MEVVKVSSKGQIVIPKSLREKLGIKEGEYLLIFSRGDVIVMKKLNIDVEEILKEGEEAAKSLGVSEEDVAKAVRKVRYGE
ncbi:transcription regulator, SpoVT/AbrB family [Thermococcus kodakarensis KOD1]|uniref:Transcription regulator, SpoVT/AbrB family n=1 Tax=Thermococcus kodakarensis (strain ATCC BAA-918 / JCM 12380 / KOD1) TaxID=69014 RepID=Q5JI32_THEKO|nr:AbrB/MazE/SpoVT family DNA-binding domain-containing protein [Thermococcus kodakarensis]WCN28880.1 AbrB/MazE/SpoVT family DNA-binding domain-containing protein [Thermococcus kodakarensis]WCN31543.1 AbrB/MazE/SpoVT family DNA-binding domain-containing protein [Thermococcus kodakarensis]BAD85077.1 transcription regulator, SpoVT/AbrB family [Thermococcus kodakarensis KOD1]